MAKYDYGGGCPCGLYRECIPQCENAPVVYVKPAKEICICGPNGYCNCTRNTEKKRNKMDNDPGDFGFTMVGDEDIIKSVPDDTRAEQLRNMIMPLLMNLKLNPEKDYIQWHGVDRVKQIDAFIEKMNKVMGS